MFSIRRIKTPIVSTSKRYFAGGHHHEKKTYTGLDFHIRKYLPEDEHVPYI